MKIENKSSRQDIAISIAEVELKMVGLIDLSLVDLISVETTSARLSRLLVHSSLGSKTLREYLNVRDKVEDWMFRQPNCGRRSVLELRSKLAIPTQRQLIEEGMTPKRAEATIAKLFETRPTPVPDKIEPPDGCDLIGHINWQLSQLKPRSADVIARRFGLGDRAAQTLAEIGDEFTLTRERIRQIEASALKRMRTICKRFAISPYLDKAQPSMSFAFFDGNIEMIKSDALQKLRFLDGYHVLALELLGLNPHDWLAKTAVEHDHGWIVSTADSIAIQSIADGISSEFETRPFPRSIKEIFGRHDKTMANAAVTCLLGWHIASGYVFLRKPGARGLRTAALHTIAAELNRPTEITTLLNFYRKAIPKDCCSDRDLVIVMEAAGHLFLEVRESHWVALGLAGASPKSTLHTQNRIIHEIGDGDEEDQETIATALERELELRGPSRLKDIMDRAVDILPIGRSVNSVGPTLLLNPSRFVRVLPGVYALPHQILDNRALLHADKLDYLLNAQQARLYSLARRSGEAWGSFRFWNIAAEMRLCRWARANAEPGLYRSLLDIASIQKWITDDLDREIWLNIQAQNSRFEIGFMPRDIKGVPPLDRFLAATIQLTCDGRIGWIMANRILGYRLDSHNAITLLDGLVRAGIAEAPDGEFAWQLPYRPGIRMDEWIERLGSVLNINGELDWAAKTSLNCWDDFTSLEQSAANSDSIDDEFDEYESIVAEHRRVAKSRRLEAQLDWLSE